MLVIFFENFAILGIINVYCILWIDSSHHTVRPNGTVARSERSGMRIVQQDPVTHRKMLADSTFVINGFGLHLVGLRTLIEFSLKLIQLIELELGSLATQVCIKVD